MCALWDSFLAKLATITESRHLGVYRRPGCIAGGKRNQKSAVKSNGAIVGFRVMLIWTSIYRLCNLGLYTTSHVGHTV